MELINGLYKYDALPEKNGTVLEEAMTFIFGSDISPFAPHFAEEMWEKDGSYAYSYSTTAGEMGPDALVMDTVEIAIQLTRQVKFRIDVPSDADKKAMEKRPWRMIKCQTS